MLLTPAGIGDLFRTSTSKKSRNYHTGYKIGKSNKVTQRILKTFVTVEGLKSIEKLIGIAKTNKINIDLLEMLYNITYNRQIPNEQIKVYFELYK